MGVEIVLHITTGFDLRLAPPCVCSSFYYFAKVVRLDSNWVKIEALECHTSNETKLSFEELKLRDLLTKPSEIMISSREDWVH